MQIDNIEKSFKIQYIDHDIVHVTFINYANISMNKITKRE